MKVSLITACFNSAKTLRTAMDSVAEQCGVDVEYIVVDGGSTDGTVDIIKDFDSQLTNSQTHQLTNFSFKWISERDKGMYDAINKGIRMATGDIVGILNADDVLENDETLAHIAQAFGKQGTGNGEQVEAVYADIRFVREDLRTTIRYYSAKRWRPWMHDWGYMPPHPSVYIRRKTFTRLGGYRLGYKISADFELMVRYFCRNRIRCAYLPECVVKMRMGGASTKNWRSNLLLNRENVRANRENGYFSILPMMFPKYAFKIWGFVFRGR